MKNNVIQRILDEKIIVIVRGVEKDKLLPLSEAMYKGGIRLLELTYSAVGTPTDTETAENIRMLSEYWGDKMYIGAGTVLTPEQVEMTANAGGYFIISPDTNPEVIGKTVELGLVSIPGALTPTEIALAARSGADFAKLFPISTMGPDYVKAVKAPLSHIKLLAVGGVKESNILDYMKAGAVGFGLGANIVDHKLIAANDWDGITELARRYVALVNGR